MALTLIICVTPSANAALLCPGIKIQGGIDPSLSDVEKRLVCGDPETPGWKKIPASQARFSVGNFLQARGYLKPAFIFEVDGFTLYPGPKTYVTSVIVNGAQVDIKKRRKTIGSALTPDLLDGLEKWSVMQLQNQGFACPDVKSSADPASGTVYLNINPGERVSIISVTEESIPGLAPQVLRRHDAFRLGKLYSGEALDLTEKRINQSQIVESAHFSTRCDTQGSRIIQETIPGPPRLLILGIGLDTELLLRVKATWSNARLGNWGSQFALTAQGSVKTQQIALTMRAYHGANRVSFEPGISISQQNETFFQVLTQHDQALGAKDWEFSDFGLRAAAGPVLDVFRTIRGVGPPFSVFPAVESLIEITSHDFEYFQDNPRAGAHASLKADFSSGQFVSNISAQRFTFRGEALWNYRDFDPPLWIFGVRGGADTVITGERPPETISLPQSFLLYLGGASNLRGFGRLELPSSGIGGLTSTYADFEVRLSNTLPEQIDPFIFADFGLIGKDPLTLNSPLFWSPGFGARWSSPIGGVRGTLSHGFTSASPDHWQAYMSLGEEF